MDLTENMACRSCGILFGDLDSLQKHIFNTCANGEKEKSQVSKTNQAGSGIKEQALEESFIDADDPICSMDFKENMACRYCGILFGNLDSLQKHISRVVRMIKSKGAIR